MRRTLGMNVSLTPELEKLVNKKVQSGKYSSASEVVREGLRLLQEQDEMRRIKLEALRREIARGVESLDRGDGKPLDIEAIKTAGRKKLALKKK
jgi:antitoxin ParD1/3/4